MIRIAICDDQPIYMKRLEQMIRNICIYKIPEKFDCHIQDGFYSANNVIDYLKNNTINILFLDIELEGINGFELASILNREYPDIKILFVSAYENYVYSAFEYAPFRFLRKSHLNKELEPALFAAIDSLTAKSKTIELNMAEGNIETRLIDIVYFESEGNYLIAHMAGNNTYRFRNTLTNILNQLSNDGFYKIHQSYVVNLANIKRISGHSQVIMCDGRTLPVSSRKATGFKKAYMDFTDRSFS